MDKIFKMFFRASSVIFITMFLFGLHSALPSYITSSFISGLTGEELVGIVYSFGAFATIISFILIPKFLRRFGNFKVATSIILLDIISLLVMAFSPSIITTIIAFIINSVSISTSAFNMDIFMEKYSSDETTGKTRGSYLTSINIAWVIAPAIAGFILSNGDYWKIFVTSAVIIFLALIVVRKTMKNFVDPEYPKMPFWSTVKNIRQNKNLQNIFAINFLLQFFYTWMAIYTPIYLYSHIGLSWQTIGIIFSIMLIPFVVIEIPLGRLADSRWGEKECLFIGFLIMAISTGIISFISDTNVVVWTIVLFITRIGASMIEIMSETYFFKKVDASLAGIISFFRMLRPISNLLGPILATLLFFIIDIKYLFLALGIIMILGLKYSFNLVDTK